MNKPFLWIFAFLLTTVIAFVFLVASNQLEISFKTFFSAIVPTSKDRNSNVRVVLVYTNYFGGSPWQGIETSQQLTHFKGRPCPVTNCTATYDKEQFSSSDVVLFYGGNLPSNLVTLHKRRPPDQAWIYFFLESPINAPDASIFNGMFSWTMYYRRDSDIRHPYGFYLPLNASDPKPSVSIDYSKGKNKLVAWTVSHCGGLRKSFVDKLKEYVTVDIYGGCGSSSCSSNAGVPSSQCNDLLRTYKFQLAFENSNCVDYVTEKYWGSPLELGIVPIVLGGADYKEIAIPGSYINVLDFPSPKALADHLLYLDKNNTAYNEYFQWKTKYKLGGVLHGNDLSHYPWMCELCAAANNRSMRSKAIDEQEANFVVKLTFDKLTQTLPSAVDLHSEGKKTLVSQQSLRAKKKLFKDLPLNKAFAKAFT